VPNRRKAACRLAQLAVTLLVLNCPSPTFAANPMEDALPIAVAAQTLGESLRSLAKQAHLQILFDSALVAGKPARALHGTMSARAALAELLRGTELEAREQAPGVVVIRRGGAARENSRMETFE
jgi:iron complex outermembrane receptor protein